MPQPAPVTESFFEQLQESSEVALVKNRRVEHKLQVGGKKLLIHSAGDSLASAMLPALSHLLSDFSDEPDLTLSLWDSHTTGVPLPQTGWEVPPTDLWKYHNGAASAIFFPNPDNLIWLDREKKKSIFWISDANLIRIVDRGSPLLALWTWWLSSFGIQLTHGAALSGEKGAALLLGKGGSGKSTTALMSLNSPLQYLADDYCLISTFPTPIVYSLYSSGKVNAAERNRFPWLEPAFQGMDHEKSLYQFGAVFKERIAAEKPLAALFSCRISGREETTIEKATPVEIMRAIAPSTIFQLRMMIDPAAALRLLADAAKQVPCYRLNLGTDRESIPGVLYEFLSR